MKEHPPAVEKENRIRAAQRPAGKRLNVPVKARPGPGPQEWDGEKQGIREKLRKKNECTRLGDWQAKRNNRDKGSLS